MLRIAFDSLRVRLTLLILLAILPGLGLTLMAYLKDRQAQTAQVQQQSLLLTRIVILYQERLTKTTHQLLASLSQVPQIHDTNPAGCNLLLTKLLKQHPLYANLGVAGPDGYVFCSAIPVNSAAKINFSDRPWFQQALQTDKFAVGNYQIGRISHKPILVFSYPVLNTAGPRKVIFASLDLAWLNQFLTQVKLPKEAAVILVDRNGTILACHPNMKGWVGQSVANTSIFKVSLSQGGSLKEISNLDGNLRLYGFTLLKASPETDVYVGVGLAKTTSFAEVNRALTHNLLGLQLIAALVIVTVWLGGELLILRPIKALVQATRQLAAGDLSVRAQIPQGRGELSRLASTFNQMAEALEQRKEQLEYQAFYDPLTRLPNRALFMDRLGSALKRAKQRKNCQFAVLFLDVDHFKMVNDSLGHQAGDQLLIAIAHRLESCLRAKDTVARLAGDEFTILLDNILNIGNVIEVVERIQTQLSRPFNLEGEAVFTTTSTGIALNVTAYDRPDDLLRNADIAMYRAKSLGGGQYVVFDPPMHDQIVTRWQLASDLRRAIEHRELALYYQPIVFLATGQIMGFEALIRWNHPERGLVSPVEFIPIAEETGLILSIGQWTLRQACAQISTWHRQFPANPYLAVSVNLSSKQLSQPDFIDQIQQVLRETGLQASSLKLELSESVIMESPEFLRDQLLQLRTMGTQLHVDDFGAGYSSLSRLQRYPINALKIDPIFVSRISTNSEGIEIVQAIVTLAQNLGLEVIAEGVESADQVAKLHQLGCEYGQGYFFSKPMDPEAAGALIAMPQA